VRYEDHQESAVLAFLRLAFPDTPLKADETFHRWRFQQGPHGDSRLNSFLAVADGRVVGQVAAIRDRIWHRDEWHDCVWIVDLMILPEYRGGYTAVNLFQQVMRSANLLFGVGAGPNLLPSYQRMGWRHVHLADTAFAVFRPHRLAALAGEPSRGLRPVVLRVAAPALRAMHELCAPMNAEVTEEIPAGTAELEARLRPHFGVTTDRTAGVLDWKFTNRPHGNHFFVALRTQELQAMAAVKVMARGQARWAEVVDYLCDPSDGDRFQGLMGSVVRASLGLDLDFVRLRASVKAHLAALRKPLWVVRNRPVIDDLLIYSRDKQLVDELCASPWHLTTIVSDRTDHGADEVTSEGSTQPTSSRRQSRQS